MAVEANCFCRRCCRDIVLLPAVPGFLPSLLWFHRMLTSRTAALFYIIKFEISPRTKTFGPPVFFRTLDESKFT